MTSIKLIALLIFLTGSVAQASLYRWVDEDGKVHFSDKVPPAMAQKGHTSLNKNGIESEKVSSAEELKKKAEEENKEQEALAEMSELKKLEAAQKNKDDQLLATYESREEIINAFTNKISLIDRSIGILSARDESITQKLKRLNKKRKQAKSESSKITLSMQIENAQESLSEYTKAIAINRADKKVMTGKYRQTLIRFDHLTKSSH